MTLELSAKIIAWWTHMSCKFRDERGLSQTTELLIILAAVIVIAGGAALFMTGIVDAAKAKVGAP